MSKPKFTLRPAWYVTISIALLILSFSITIQYNTQKVAANTLENQNTEDLVTLVRSLNDKRDKLEAEMATLYHTYSSMNVTETIEKQTRQLSIFTGTIPIMGPGVSVAITADSPVLNLDLIDIINELKVSGAEAIAINNIRITTKSKLAQETDTTNNSVITLDGQTLMTPIVITAIGNAADLEKGLTFTGGIMENLSTLYNIHPVVKQEEKITIPASNISQTSAYKKSTITKPTTTPPTPPPSTAPPNLKKDIRIP